MWKPELEPFSFGAAASRGKSGSEAIQLRVEQTMGANTSPTTVGTFLRSLKTKIEGNISASALTTTSISDSRQAKADSQRPSVVAYCVKNETCRSLCLWLPYNSLRRNLKGYGAELGIEMPTEDGLWSSGAAHEQIDGNSD